VGGIEEGLYVPNWYQIGTLEITEGGVGTKLHDYKMLQMGSASLKQQLLGPCMPLPCSCI
jgi:hypothetical protein